MRFCIGVGDDEDSYALVTGPLGGLLTYDNPSDAGDAARAIVKGSVAAGKATGVFTLKLVPVAYYMPTTSDLLAVGQKEDPDEGKDPQAN